VILGVKKYRFLIRIDITCNAFFTVCEKIPVLRKTLSGFVEDPIRPLPKSVFRARGKSFKPDISHVSRKTKLISEEV